MEVIGTTKCDNERRKREKDIDKIVQNANFDLTNYDPSAVVALKPLDYWREALSCYQNGAYMACSLMCRCITELVVYMAVTRRDNIPKNFRCGSVKVDFNFIEKRWGDILCFAKEQGIVKGNLERRINKIREKGNYVAHFGSIVDKSYLCASNREVKGRWLRKEEAHQHLEQAVKIIHDVLKNLAEST